MMRHVIFVVLVFQRNVFFKDICDIQLELRQWKTNENEILHLMVGPMTEKFEKYWENYNLVLAIGVVLDPRFKMDLVKFYYEQLYDNEASVYVQRIQNAVVDLFNEYGGNSLNSSKFYNNVVVTPQKATRIGENKFPFLGS